MVEKKKKEWSGMACRIRKVKKNEKIEWNGIIEMGGVNKWRLVL